jgi:hypothetical protein
MSGKKPSEAVRLRRSFSSEYFAGKLCIFRDINVKFLELTLELQRVFIST